MIATFVNDDGTTRTVRVDLSALERHQLRRARLLARFVPFTCPADFMSAELEEIVCGYREDRYTPVEAQR